VVRFCHPHKRKIGNHARAERLAQLSHFNCHSERSRGISLFPTHRNGNVTAAAKKLGISRRTLHRKINEMNAAKTEETNKL
jgi:transcriptional regulator of acetoin/glycerol metabolism